MSEDEHGASFTFRPANKKCIATCVELSTGVSPFWRCAYQLFYVHQERTRAEVTSYHRKCEAGHLHRADSGTLVKRAGKAKIATTKKVRCLQCLNALLRTQSVFGLRRHAPCKAPSALLDHLRSTDHRQKSPYLVGH